MALHSMCQPGRPSPHGLGQKTAAVLRHARLPEGKIGHRFLGVFIAADPLAGAHFFKVQFEQLAIAAAARLVFFDAEINRAVRRAISHAAGHQLFDQRNNFGDVVAGAGRFVRTQAVERLEILEEGRLIF